MFLKLMILVMKKIKKKMVKKMVTTTTNTELKKTIKKVIKDNPKIVKSYRDGKKGLIGALMKKVIQESTSSFYTKKSTQNLVSELKKKLNS